MFGRDAQKNRRMCQLLVVTRGLSANQLKMHAISPLPAHIILNQTVTWYDAEGCTDISEAPFLLHNIFSCAKPPSVSKHCDQSFINFEAVHVKLFQFWSSKYVIGDKLQ